MESLAEVLKSAREAKGLLLREVAYLIDSDTALVSKFEKGDRKPTRIQIDKLATALSLNKNELQAIWLSDKLLDSLKNEEVALEALKLAEIKMIKSRK
ncbi:Putative DNA binding protein [Flavobacterium indicum GPTSA100-9 = DSM 17447]|uniref:Putative DNA binding protein n=1 Tax=Flavobacterium indicum (strain DSM 17447 / CIP 109464 / GPTSA100-9) TaxID=1094466 RepID=H8XNK1_FLAIG|nr:helix-turn-helix transcriptional regulator [Flavobacterium indicum]CCG52118.1 Putative DNA binding protein [Flavobacterium indicum GPTSA100-9 = DSM 17447]